LNCQAKIDILIKKLTPVTTKRDPYLKGSPPLQGVIKIKADHNHHTDTLDAINQLRVTLEVRKTYEEYFSSGCGPSEAHRIHESELMMEEDCVVKMANASINPKLRTVTHLHEKWRTSEYGKAWLEKSSMEVLKAKKQK